MTRLYATKAALEGKQPRTLTLHAGPKCPTVKKNAEMVEVKGEVTGRKCAYCFG